MSDETTDHEVSIDEIKLWKVDALKSFLRVRGFKTSGRKEELVALVFACHRRPSLAPLPKPVSCDEDFIESLLSLPDGYRLPNPKKLNQWESEEKSIRKWPPTMAMEIGKFLGRYTNDELANRLMKDYKDQKAYSYFASGWVSPLEYHPISQTSKHCFVKAKCMPSQRVKDIPWEVWVAIEKESGQVFTAYCTCFAGRSSTCNHVAAVLFKIDAGWKLELSNPSCTSMECTWSAFAGKQAAEPRRLNEMKFCKPMYSKQGSSQGSINTERRKNFMPVHTSPSLDELKSKLLPQFEGACIQTYLQDGTPGSLETYPCSDSNVGREEETVTQPVTAEELLRKMPIEDVLSYKYDTRMVEHIKTITCGQSTNSEWKSQRIGRVTGSVAHDIFVKEQKHRHGRIVNWGAILSKVLGHSVVNPNLPALKHGRDLEDEARMAYIREHSCKHKDLEVTTCGLVVDKVHVYLAASPDGLISCDCCGKGVLEIKCPYSVANAVPSVTNLDYLVNEEDTIKLKRSSAYYTQVQVQMGVTTRTWCHFFVYTRKGSLTLKVPFEAGHFADICTKSENFFKSKVAPCIKNKGGRNY